MQSSSGFRSIQSRGSSSRKMNFRKAEPKKETNPDKMSVEELISYMLQKREALKKAQDTPGSDPFESTSNTNMYSTKQNAKGGQVAREEQQAAAQIEYKRLQGLLQRRIPAVQKQM
jgi:predicted metal-dependent peptidase